MSDHPPCQATPNATLREQVMDCRIPKSEREWWASREIESLERRNAELVAEFVEEKRIMALAVKQQSKDRLADAGMHRERVAELTARVAELTKERDALDRDYQEEKAIVSRIWEMFGNPTYAELKVRSIYDLIAEARKDGQRLDWLETLANVKLWEQQTGRWHIQLDTLIQPNLIKGETLRAAIDAAMLPEPKEGK